MGNQLTLVLHRHHITLLADHLTLSPGSSCLKWTTACGAKNLSDHDRKGCCVSLATDGNIGLVGQE